jgi:hypothetical protein
VIPHEKGFQVYAADTPEEVYEVSGEPEEPRCTCREFKWQRGKPCRHITAVFPEEQSGEGYPEDAPFLSQGEEEHYAQQGMRMTLKRSVSPDGKIDSLSVEFSVPANGLHSDELEGLALSTLDRQQAIVEAFLEANGRPQSTPRGRNHKAHTNGHSHNNRGNGTVEAMLRDIGGFNTRHGWRYFINVECNRELYKLFGTRKQLGEHLEKAGYGQLSSRIAQGVFLDVPCLAQLEPSEDGRYTNVVSIFPDRAQTRRGRH